MHPGQKVPGQKFPKLGNIWHFWWLFGRGLYVQGLYGRRLYVLLPNLGAIARVLYVRGLVDRIPCIIYKYVHTTTHIFNRTYSIYLFVYHRL